MARPCRAAPAGAHSPSTDPRPPGTSNQTAPSSSGDPGHRQGDREGLGGREPRTPRGRLGRPRAIEKIYKAACA